MTTWEEVLKQAGYPQTAIVLDFETYFDKDYSLKEMSTVEYVMDKRFEVLGLGVQHLGLTGSFADSLAAQIQFLDPEQTKIYLEDFQSGKFPDITQYTIVCQNCFFDCLILQEHFGITPRYTVDIKDLDRIWDARAKHSLDAMAKRWGAPTLKGDTKQFKGLHWADMTLEQRKALGGYCKNDVEIGSFLLQKLLPLIPIPSIELPLATQTLQLFLKPQIQIDQKLGQELKRNMRLESLKPRLELRKRGIKAGKKTISGNISFAKLLSQYADMPTKMGKKGLIPALAKDDEGLKFLLTHEKEEVQLLAQARQAVKSWPLHIARVDSLMNQANARGGLIGSPLSFYAAHTGRWGGTEGINLQNFGGRGRGGSGTHPLIQRVRNMLVAPDGYVFGTPDLSQIQARIVAWLAGQDDLVKGFANGEDIYSEFMRSSFGWYVRKVKKDDPAPAPVCKLLTIRRGFGKDAILGCGFGMGDQTFYERCLADSNLRPLFDSGQYNQDFIKSLIRAYRIRYPMIPAFWKAIENAWRFVTKYPSEKVQISGPISFFNKDSATYAVLPSGRYLRYPNPVVKRDGRLAYRWANNVWGGFLTENVVQAIEVDLVGEALLAIEKVGFDIVFHSHDEIICLFKKDRAEEDLKEVSRIMSIVPSWATGLPIAVEGELAERYKK